jgi:hypothetical protein
VTIPRGALYEPVFYAQSVVNQQVAAREDGVKSLSPLHRVGDPAVPLKSAMTVSIAAQVPDNQHSKACLAMVSPTGALSFAGGKYSPSNGTVTGSVSTFSTYCVAADTTPPKVTASFAEGANLTNTKNVTISASDSFSGLSTFSGTIDGQWIIFERNVSRGQYVHSFDTQRLTTGQKHVLEFRIRDRMGNMTVFRRTFFK